MKNVLVLYGANSVFTNTVRDYLEAFSLHSKNNVFFHDAVLGAQLACEFKYFDAIILTYSARLSMPDYLSPWIVEELLKFKGVKFLTIQDEYENTECARKWMDLLHFDIVFTCVPKQYIENVYPKSRYPKTEFVTVLTGYVPDHLSKRPTIPMSERTTLVGYRGRPLHPIYGDLGQEKMLIGRGVKQYAQKHGHKVDIEWSEEARIYGPDWNNFLASCRATLGTESGANIFDIDGTLRKKIDAYLKTNPGADYQEIKRLFLLGKEDVVAKMNQISPKMFEAIVSRTALILFEGEYSGVLKPGVHYFELKKDFSNLADAFDFLNNFEKLEEQVTRAYQDIIVSGSYSYKKFVSSIEDLLSVKFNVQSKVSANWQDRQIVVGFYDEQTCKYELCENLGLHKKPFFENEFSIFQKKNILGIGIGKRGWYSSFKYFSVKTWRSIPDSIRQSIGPTLKSLLMKIKIRAAFKAR